LSIKQVNIIQRKSSTEKVNGNPHQRKMWIAAIFTYLTTPFARTLSSSPNRIYKTAMI
jgi:hypothetical protein